MKQENLKLKTDINDFKNAIVMPSFTSRYVGAGKELIEKTFGPEVAGMYGYDQKNPYHVYDLLIHSIRTVGGISPRGLTPEEFLNLRTAALFHDIAKPQVASWDEKKQRMRYFNHAGASAGAVEDLLVKLDFSETDIRQILFLIAHHDDFTNFRSDRIIAESGTDGYQRVNEKNLNRLIEKNAVKDGRLADRREYLLLFRLCEADVNAQAQTVTLNGKVVKHRENVLETLAAIRKCLKHMENSMKIT